MHCQYIPIRANEVVEENNHHTRNALTPALTSTEILEKNWERMSPEQRQKHLSKIKKAVFDAIAILEENNSSIEQGKILIFQRKEELASGKNTSNRRHEGLPGRNV